MPGLDQEQLRVEVLYRSGSGERIQLPAQFAEPPQFPCRARLHDDLERLRSPPARLLDLALLGEGAGEVGEVQRAVAHELRAEGGQGLAERLPGRLRAVQPHVAGALLTGE